MPHAVLSGEVDLEALARDFRPVLLRRGPDVLRIDHVFCDEDRRNLLLEALVIEAGRKQPFYVKISQHESSGTTTIRIDPLTHPERSAGVRELVAHVVTTVLSQNPAAEIGANNLALDVATGEQR